MARYNIILQIGNPMKRSYNKSILSVVACFLSILCLSVTGNAAKESGNDFFDMDIAQLMQITITSVAKKPQNLSDSAAAVFVITQDDIHRSGVTSIPEALRMAPGIQVARIDSNKWAITSRGFAGNFANKLLVMIDGRAVYSPAFSGVYWDTQDTMLEDIDRIEVIRGPGATIWGANAVNGVVNIISKKASDTQGGLVSFGGGDHNQAMTGLRYGTSLGENSHGRAYIKYQKQDSFKLHETGSDANDDWDSLRTGFRLDGEEEGKSSWTLQGDFYSNNENQLLSPFWTATPPYVSEKKDDFETSGWNILGRWQAEISKTSSWTIQAYYDYTNRDEVIMEQTHRTVDLDAQFQSQVGTRNNFIIGLGYRSVDADFSNTYQVSVEPGSRSENLYSGFIQDEIMLIADRLWLTLGVKWEHNDFTDNEFQPSGRLLWKATDTQTVWAAVSRAVRTPSEFEESGSITMAVIPTIPPDSTKIILNGSEHYGSENLLAYEAGYRWLVLSNVSFDVSVFYNDYDNLQTTEPVMSRSSTQLYFSNNMSGATYGLELASDWKPTDWLKFQFGYTYIGFDLEVDSNSFSQRLDEKTEGTSPQNQFSVRSAININKDLQLNLWVRYVDSLNGFKALDSRDDVHVDDYLTFDANVSWRLTEKLELMLVGQNLLDSSHLEYVSEFSSPTTDIERSVYGKIIYHF